MNLSEIVAVTGLPGLFKIAAQRNDGLIVTSLTDNKTQFVSGRTNLFSSLDNITIYTTGEEETTPLKQVLADIKKSGAANPDVKDEKALKTWMEKVLPSYDKDRVHVSDMKKLAKWYALLDDKKLIEELTAEKAEGETELKKDFDTHKDNKHNVAKSDQGAKANTKPAPVRKVTTPRKAT